MATKRDSADKSDEAPVVEIAPSPPKSAPAPHPSDVPGATVLVVGAGSAPASAEPAPTLIALAEWAALGSARNLPGYAGFIAHAKANGHKRATADEWAALFKTFMNAPVRS